MPDRAFDPGQPDGGGRKQAGDYNRADNFPYDNTTDQKEALGQACSVPDKTHGGAGGGWAPIGSAGGWSADPAKPWDEGPFDENEEITSEWVHLERMGEIMDESKKLEEARKSKKKKKADETPESEGYTYAETFDFSKPLGELNLYRGQGASNIGPYTNANSTWPVLEKLVKESHEMTPWELLEATVAKADAAAKEEEDPEDGFSEIDPKDAHKRGAKDPKALAAHIKKKKAAQKPAPKKENESAGSRGTPGKTTVVIVDQHGREIVRHDFDPRAFDNKKLAMSQPAPAGQPGKPWPKGYQLLVIGPNGEERHEQF